MRPATISCNNHLERERARGQRLRMNAGAGAKKQLCAASATQHNLCMLDGAHASLSPVRPPTPATGKWSRLADWASGERPSLRKPGWAASLPSSCTRDVLVMCLLPVFLCTARCTRADPYTTGMGDGCFMKHLHWLGRGTKASMSLVQAVCAAMTLSGRRWQLEMSPGKHYFLDASA